MLMHSMDARSGFISIEEIRGKVVIGKNCVLKLRERSSLN